MEKAQEEQEEVAVQRPSFRRPFVAFKSQESQLSLDKRERDRERERERERQSLETSGWMDGWMDGYMFIFTLTIAARFSFFISLP